MKVLLKMLLSLAVLLSSHTVAKTQIWACKPSHWVNLRLDGPDLNPGKETMFVLKISEKQMSTSGKGSWLNDGEFEIFKEMTLGSTHFFKGKSEWNSQFVFSDTTGEFFHSSATIGVVVSIVGQCDQAN